MYFCRHRNTVVGISREVLEHVRHRPAWAVISEPVTDAMQVLNLAEAVSEDDDIGRSLSSFPAPSFWDAVEWVPSVEERVIHPLLGGGRGDMIRVWSEGCSSRTDYFFSLVVHETSEDGEIL